MQILDEFGLADLSMRRIATSLGVHPGALYWHVDNKQTLLAVLAEEVLAGLDAPADSRDDTLIAWCTELRDRLLAHRDGADLVSSVLSMRLLPTSPVDRLVVALGDRVGSDHADAAAALLVHFVLGHTLDRQGYAQSRELGIAGPPGADPDNRFRYGVRTLVASLH